MGDIRNCKKCGRMYSYMGGKVYLCEECVAEEQDDFKKVKEYLYANPGAIMTQVASDTGISTKKLTRYLREGRLEIHGEEGKNLLLPCDNCGKGIKSGKLCNDCEGKLKSNIKGFASRVKQEVFKKEEGTSKNATGMRYLNKK